MESHRDDATIEFARHMQRLDPRPGDHFVLTVPRALSTEQHMRLRMTWAQFTADMDPRPQIFVLEPGFGLGVVNAAQIGAVEPSTSDGRGGSDLGRR